VVKKSINDTIDAVFPKLFAVGTHTFTLQATKTTYEIPADVQTVLYVSWSVVGPSNEWLPVKSWRHDPLANATSFTTRNSVSVYDRISPGRTVQVYYVIMYGAAYRLASFIDPGRLTYTSAEADNTDTKIQYGSGASTARFLLALFTQRLTEESEKLRDVYPSKIHYTRY
jgi:hypothetical protein